MTRREKQRKTRGAGGKVTRGLAASLLIHIVPDPERMRRNFQYYFRVGTEPLTSAANCQAAAAARGRGRPVDTPSGPTNGRADAETTGGAAETAGTRGNGQPEGGEGDASESLCGRM